MKVVSNALPKDTKFIRSFSNDPSGWGKIGLVVESNEFDGLKDDQEIPVIEPLFKYIS